MSHLIPTLYIYLHLIFKYIHKFIINLPKIRCNEILFIHFRTRCMDMVYITVRIKAKHAYKYYRHLSLYWKLKHWIYIYKQVEIIWGCWGSLLLFYCYNFMTVLCVYGSTVYHFVVKDKIYSFHTGVLSTSSNRSLHDVRWKLFAKYNDKIYIYSFIHKPMYLIGNLVTTHN